MTNGQDDNSSRSSGSSELSAERPLDALLPELRQDQAQLPQTAVHQRVLEVEREDGYEWVFAVWSDPGDVRALHRQLRQVVEATLLAHLSQPPRNGDALRRRYRSLRLFVFPELPYDIEPAVRAFAMKPSTPRPASDEVRLAALRRDAERMGVPPPTKATTIWEAPISTREGTLGEHLEAIHEAMIGRMKDDVWGATPGGPSRLFANLVKQVMGEEIRPDVDGLRSFEMLSVQTAPGVVRWMEPLIFQALCDFVGIVAAMEWDRSIDWAVCAPDETGLAPPPVLRMRTPDGAEHIPIGPHVLAWSIMPLSQEEQADTLTDWAVSQFGPAADSG